MHAIELTTQDAGASIAEHSKCITELMTKGAGGWPRVVRHPSPSARPDPDGKRFDVLISGKIAHDITIQVDASLKDVGAWSAGDCEKLRREWKIAAIEPGGFVVHAARAIYALGRCRIHLATILPVPLPSKFQLFLDEVDADTRHCVAWLGRAPASILLKCRDGCKLLCRDGVLRSCSPPLPSDHLDHYDMVLLALPGDTAMRQKTLDLLQGLVGARSRPATIGIVGRPDMTKGDLGRINGTGAWLFLNEALAVLAGLPAASGCMSTEGATRTIRQHLGESERLVVTCGAKGAYLSNGLPDPQYIPTLPIRATRTVGPGDTFAAATTLSSAAGFDDPTCVEQGNLAALYHAAGLDSAAAWDELDPEDGCDAKARGLENVHDH